MSLFGLTLLSPGFLVLALLVPAALWFGARGRPAVRFAPARLFPARDPLPRSWRVVLRPTPRILLGLGLMSILLALARPAEREAVPVSNDGIDILLCLDTSSSMKSNDLDRRRTRLEVARDEAIRFVRGRPNDRIGLLAFARYPDVRCPLTRDHDALMELLGQMATVTAEGPEDATGIGTAVARSADVLDASDAPSRVVILLTDGQENVALEGVKGEIPPAQAAQLCQQLGVRVYPIAIGAQRASADPSKRNEVEALAKKTGGAYFAATDADAMASVYAQIDELETVPAAEPRIVFQDRYLAFLAVGIVLLLLGAILAATVWDVLP